MICVTKEFEFSAAHHLTKYHGTCEQPHGHNYKLQVTVCDRLNTDDLVIDFSDLKKIVQTHILKKIDHTDLNDQFPNPSCEIIAQWIFNTLKPHLKIQEVKLWETSTSWVTYSEN